MYLLAKFYGIAVFTYEKKSQQLKVSKKYQIIFASFRSISLIIYITYIFKCFFEYENIIIKIMFLFQKSVVMMISLLVIISQITKANLYKDLINTTIKMINLMKLKLQNDDFFDRTFFMMFAIKITTNTYAIFCDFPTIFDFEKHWIDVLGTINLIIIWMANLAFFNFAFIGLLVGSAFYNNFFQYLQQFTKNRDLEEFSKIYNNFKFIFKSFLKLTELHFFFIFLFYMINIGAGLSSLIIGNEANSKWKSLSWGYQICCIIDLMLFNIAADLVERSSRKNDFHNVDLLRNDSIEVL